MRPGSSYLYSQNYTPYNHNIPSNYNRGTYGVIDNKKWPEDIECVWPSKTPHKGQIFVSNVEAA